MSPLDTTLELIAARLNDQPFFAVCPALAEIQDGENFEDTLAVLLNTYGAAVTVKLPSNHIRYENSGGPGTSPLVEFDFHVEIWFNPFFPAVATTILTIIANLTPSLHLWTPDNLNQPLAQVVHGRITTNGPEDDNDFIVIPLTFRVSSGFTVGFPQVALPTITNSAGTLTLTCGTGGAAMFYTTDGTRPGPRNGTHYTGPFTPGAGHKVVVRAYLAGYLTSAPAILQT